jgi:signal transduction histidine kinase
MSILVLTPDSEAASALCAALARSGLETAWESSSAAASGRLLDAAPEVLVLDTALEGRAGVVADLKALAPWARVVLIGECREAERGGLPLFPKPFDASALAVLLTREQELARVLESRLALHRQVENAERLASIGRVSAGMAHEINNPLAVIRASAAYVAMVAARSDDGELATCAEDIEVAVARIGSFVEHLSGFASHERPRIVHAPLRPALEMAVRMLRAYANESEVEVVVHTEPVLCVPHDAPRLAQALLNLLCYAVRRAAQGGKHLELRARGMESEVYIEVDDDGPRPTPKAAAQAFDVFGSSNDANGAVSGLGLSITRRIAHDHGGSVWLEPLEVGARAVLTLPRFNPNVYTLLVVDGDAELRRALASELRREGFDVLAAAAFEEARPMLRGREVHLALVASDLADLDEPLSVRLQRESPRTRGLVLYGGSNGAAVRAADAPGLKRPYDHAELMRAIRALCQSAADGGC